MSSDHIKERFRALKAGHVVALHGRLTDAMAYETLQGLLANGTVIDCQGLISASWAGLQSLYRFLDDNAAENLRLINVPAFIYRHLRIMRRCGKRVMIDSFEIELAANDGSLVKTVVPMLDLETAGRTQGEYVQLPQGRSFEPVSQICPRFFGTVVPVTYVNPWSQERQEETAFWRNYIAFVGETTSAAQLMLTSIEHGLTDMTLKIAERVDCAERGFAGLFGIKRREDSKTIAAVADKIHERCQEIAAVIDATVAACEAAARDLKMFSMAEKPGVPTIYTSMSRLARAVQVLGKATASIEDAGEAIGKKILSLKVTAPYKQALLRIEADKIQPASLEALRSEFLIMDVLSEGNWFETRKLILAELEQVDAGIGTCVVHLQGFDLVRQLLEHRIHETAMLAQGLPLVSRGARDWKDLAAELEEMICDAMVTEQEKLACEFFLPGAFTTYGKVTSSGAGDVLIF